MKGEGLTAGAQVAAPAAKPVLPVILLAVAAAGLWASSRMTWVTVHSADNLTEPRTDNLDGGTWFGALTPLALVLVAAIAAVFAVKGVLRQLLGVVVAVVAAVAAVPGFALTIGAGKTDERAGTLAELPGRATVTGAETHIFPAVLSVLAAACALAAGVLLTRRAETTAQLSGKYDNPVFRRADASAQVNNSDGAAPLSDRVLWDALDAGTDPTDTADTADTRDDDDRPGRRDP
ncbi:TIGR02234 family membrane protein [Nocardia rosealba]|uniref:TIGR02234 family membrane protein n=1 Tax=Nocardia rosealba TaxID=2878563 RepID=UPI001CD99CF5|nr:TIGR02234 family membrane protein [Nocardia rosealba]MCA2211013.1 TIGR02234 family membrane protein [Nocardia rosealba]